KLKTELNDAYLQFVKEHPEDEMCPEYLFRAANIARSQQNYNKAIQVCKEVIEKYPNFKSVDAVHFFIAFVYDNDIQDKSKASSVYNDVAKKYHPDFFKIIEDQYKGNFAKYVDDLYANSAFASQTKFDKFMKNPSKEMLAKDPAYIAAKSIYAKYNELQAASKKFDEELSKGRRLYLAGLMEMQPDKNFYPDANFTMRLTYGKVGDYRPRDGVIYDYYTTLAGVMEKEIPGDFEFSVPEKLKELYNKKDYGQYADKDGKMHVCFISNNDITGGNSGSPIMNGNGELIGLAFDGNWEAMSGDIAFEPELQRTINVDIRYVLFIIDKLGGAKHLIDEMTIKK
ncbi:MAG: S46 family peptidase, partial [Bacteroidales bacterium]|nr:S46 family peptidase [Bacteroidales bacterium]